MPLQNGANNNFLWVLILHFMLDHLLKIVINFVNQLKKPYGWLESTVMLSILVQHMVHFEQANRLHNRF
jgi:hypothetical protein